MSKVSTIMKITKNSAVRFVARVYDRWGMVPKDKEFSFSLRYSNVLGSKDNKNYNIFLQCIEHGSVVSLNISGKSIGIANGVEIIKEEVKKWENIKHFKKYRVKKVQFLGTPTWFKDYTGNPLEECDLDYTAEMFASEMSYSRYDWRNHWDYDPPKLYDFKLFENNQTTGEFYESSEEDQTKFQEKFKNYWLEQRQKNQMQ